MACSKAIMALDAIVAPPTMENLFGNIDYCACSHCKSVLSPAAYLVDLLQFLDLTGKTFTRTNPIDRIARSAARHRAHPAHLRKHQYRDALY
jgi:hypothetical protein